MTLLRVRWSSRVLCLAAVLACAAGAGRATAISQRETERLWLAGRYDRTHLIVYFEAVRFNDTFPAGVEPIAPASSTTDGFAIFGAGAVPETSSQANSRWRTSRLCVWSNTDTSNATLLLLYEWKLRNRMFLEFVSFTAHGNGWSLLITR